MLSRGGRRAGVGQRDDDRRARADRPRRGPRRDRHRPARAAPERARLSTPSASRVRSAWLEVGPEVLDVLDADREPQQVRRRADRGVDRRAAPGARSATRPRPGWSRGVISRTRCAHRARRRSAPPATSKRDHRAEAGVQPAPRARARGRRAGRGSAPGVTAGARPAARPARARWPAPAPAARQRAQPAQRQVGLERAGHRAGERRAARAARSASSASRGHQHAHEQVGVPGQVLGRRVHDDVGAEFERAHARAACENVASTPTSAPAACAAAISAGRSGTAEQRVGRPSRARAGRAPSQRGQHGVGVGDVDRPHRHPAQLAAARRRSRSPRRSSRRRGTTATVPDGRPSTTAAIAAMPLAKAERRAALELAERRLERRIVSSVPWPRVVRCRRGRCRNGAVEHDRRVQRGAGGRGRGRPGRDDDRFRDACMLHAIGRRSA